MNSIDNILTNDNVWIDDWQGIGGHFEQYYISLFTSSNPVYSPFLDNLITPSISDELNSSICSIPSAKLVKNIVFSMKNGKSPGPDGMAWVSYKIKWPYIVPKIIHVVQYVFETGHMLKSLNHTFIALVPKIESAHKVEHFRAIALCNLSHKIITKILASRLKPILGDITCLSQAAFIPNRGMTDNVIISQEIMHHLNRKRGKLCLMALKIDMAEA